MAGAAVAVGTLPGSRSWIGTANAQAKRGGLLRITTTGAGAEMLDPNFLLTDVELRICEMLYNCLVGVDENLNLIPDLAQEWAISADAKTHEYKLRRGVMFHHGRELNAKDVEFTLNRMKDSWTSYLLSDLDRIELTDSHSVRLLFKRPAAYFLASMAPRWTGIVPHDLIEKNGKDAFNANPVGTGAFKFVERVLLQKTVIERNENYFEAGKPYLDRIEWIPVQDENSRSLQIIGGTADADLWAPLKLLDSLKAAPNVEILGGPTTRYEFAELNNNREPFSKVEMRKAVTLATDRQAIVDLALFGHGEPLVGGPIGPAGNPWFNNFQTYSKPDIEQAKSLVASAGYGGGVTVEGISAGGSRYSDVMEVLQQQWAQIGIKVKITIGEMGAVKAQRKKGMFDVVTEGWGTLIDPNDFVGQQFRTDGGGLSR